uniref:Large ribosomal subunit protein mL43 n=1 Tax=Pyrodinium bahamense TaxID=73915 RepID=A0A7S0FAJ8_9DINO
MNAATGQWQLKRIILRYSESGGSSLGLRFYLRHLLPVWKERNPQIVVVTEHSRLDHPQLQAEWASGEKYEYSMRNLRPRQIEDHMDLVRNSESPNLFLRHGGPRVWTERRSIQGLWQPSAEGMFRALKFAREKSWAGRKSEQLKYSPTTLKLTEQHLLERRGRWGDQNEHPKGFDRHLLEDIFNRPLLDVSEGPAAGGSATT